MQRLTQVITTCSVKGQAIKIDSHLGLVRGVERGHLRAVRLNFSRQPGLSLSLLLGLFAHERLPPVNRGVWG